MPYPAQYTENVELRPPSCSPAGPPRAPDAAPTKLPFLNSETDEFAENRTEEYISHAVFRSPALTLGLPGIHFPATRVTSRYPSVQPSTQSLGAAGGAVSTRPVTRLVPQAVYPPHMFATRNMV